MSALSRYAPDVPAVGLRRLWSRQLPDCPDTGARTVYLGVAVMAIVLYFQHHVFLMTGRWGPRRAREDEAAHERLVERELARLQTAGA